MPGGHRQRIACCGEELQVGCQLNTCVCLVCRANAVCCFQVNISLRYIRPGDVPWVSFTFRPEWILSWPIFLHTDVRRALIATTLHDCYAPKTVRLDRNEREIFKTYFVNIS